MLVDIGINIIMFNTYEVVAVMASRKDMSNDTVGWTLLSTDMTQVKRNVFLHTTAKGQHRQTWKKLQTFSIFSPLDFNKFYSKTVPSVHS